MADFKLPSNESELKIWEERHPMNDWPFLLDIGQVQHSAD